MDIEPLDENADNYEQRIKRMKFYEKNGFRDTGYCLVDTTGEYTVLSTSDNFSIEDYKKTINKIGMNLYKPKIVKV